MIGGPEWTHAEEPFLDQLVQMGWKYTTGNLAPPLPIGNSHRYPVGVASIATEARS